MKIWQKGRNFRKYEKADGTFIYIITVDGIGVEVCAEIFSVYAKTARKMEYMEYDLKRNRVMQNADGKAVLDSDGQPVLLPEREVSLDKLISEDWDFPSTAPSPEESFFAPEESDEAELHHCSTKLTSDEQALVKALFFEGLTEQAYAEKLGIRQQSVNERKNRILKKIKKLWRQPC
jgi:RNA polymerase sigma factor (sigma-70 family)